MIWCTSLNIDLPSKKAGRSFMFWTFKKRITKQQQVCAMCKQVELRLNVLNIFRIQKRQKLKDTYVQNILIHIKRKKE